MQLFQNFAAACGGGRFLGFPHWYQYLKGVTDSKTKLCSPALSSINDVWLILAAIIEIMLRVAALAAVVYVIYGGILYTLSQGEPEKTSKARNTILNALIGLVISLLAASTVTFLAERIN